MSNSYAQFARLIPSNTSLNIILKNTHFKDDILDEKNEIILQIAYAERKPVLKVNFQEPFYDFKEILQAEDFKGERGQWLQSNNIVIQLMLADAVIGDSISTRIFTLGSEESQKLRSALEQPQF